MTIFEKAMINDIKYFKDNDYDINQVDFDGKSLLHYAVLGSSFDVVGELIRRGININQVDINGESAIFDCARKAKLEIAKLLIINYAKLDLLNYKLESLFHLASAKGNKQFIQLLLENDAIINTETINNTYPIHYSILAGQIDIIKYILSITNQSFLILDKFNNTLLHYATQTSNDLMIYFLISEGVNPNLLNDSFETPLFNAVKFGNKETVNALLGNDAFIDIYNKQNESPIDYCHIYERYSLETLLTNYKMLPKYERLVNRLALTLATLNRDHLEVKKLIENDHISRNDKFNYSAIDYAKLYNFDKITKLLKYSVRD